MPSCNLAETVHNRWLQQSGNQMMCLYEATVDDLIRAFMQTTNYRTYLKRGRSGKGPDKAELRLRVAQRSGDAEVIAKVLSSFPGAEDLITKPRGLEGAEIFGSSKRKLDLPPGSHSDSHRQDKVNFSIPRMNTRSTKACIEEALSDPVHAVQHTTCVLKTDCDTSKWHIARLPARSGRRCQALQANTNAKCDTRVARGSHGTPAPTYFGKKRDYHTKKSVEVDFWFCVDDIKRCVSGNKKPWVLDWPAIPRTWPVKLGTNLSQKEVFALEDAGFQLQQRGAMSPRRMFVSSVDMPICREQFLVPSNPDSHKTVRGNSTIHRNGDAPTPEHRNQWKSASHMSTCQVTNITAIPYPGYGVVIALDSSKGKVYYISITDFPSCTCLSFVKMMSGALGKRLQWIYCKNVYYIFRYICKMDYKVDTFMHAPSYSYNEVMQVLELAAVIGPRTNVGEMQNV